MSGLERKKKFAFSSPLKLDSDDDWVMTSGDRLLHTRAASTGNARSSIVELFDLRTTGAVVDDRRCRPATTSDARRAPMTGTMEPFHVDIGTPVPPDSIICGACDHGSAQKQSDMSVLPDRENQSSGWACLKYCIALYLKLKDRLFQKDSFSKDDIAQLVAL